MKRPGLRIEESISKNSKLSIYTEGATATLPFFINSPEQLSRFISLDGNTMDFLSDARNIHRFRVPDFYAGLMDKQIPSCPIRIQAIPSPLENDENGLCDPLGENSHSITPALIQKHPNRVVFLVTSQCAMYCRFCNRKRLVGTGWDPGPFRELSLDHIERDSRINEVILSGGDPFMMMPEALEYILSRLRRIPHVHTIRISTRMPVVFPAGITSEHIDVMERYAPLWIVIHINHPKEVSPEFLGTISRIRKSGQILISQTVLLRAVNDCPYVLSKLFSLLVASGIKPYYLFQLDEAQGLQHFKVRLERGIEIMKIVRRDCSGLAIPQYVIDIPGGLGKVPLDYPYVRKPDARNVTVENTEGNFGAYANDAEESRCIQCGICRT